MKKNERPFTRLWRDVLESDAFGAMSINGWRFVRFLLIEDSKHKGKSNGQLLAPYKQLEKFGITPRLVASAINEVEALGLVDCHRGGMRVATTYTINWLPLPDGTMPPERWRNYTKEIADGTK